MAQLHLPPPIFQPLPLSLLPGSWHITLVAFSIWRNWFLVLAFVPIVLNARVTLSPPCGGFSCCSDFLRKIFSGPPIWQNLSVTGTYCSLTVVWVSDLLLICGLLSVPSQQTAAQHTLHASEVSYFLLHGQCLGWGPAHSWVPAKYLQGDTGVNSTEMAYYVHGKAHGPVFSALSGLCDLGENLTFWIFIAFLTNFMLN